jgi:hypothetical protein
LFVLPVSLTPGFFFLTFQRTLGSFMTVAFQALGPAREALNSRLASTKVSSDSFISTLCGYLRSNHSFVQDVKQERRRKSVSDASVEVARKEKNRLKKLPIGEEVPSSPPWIGGLFMG